MELAIRRFARRVLLIHVALLVIVVAIVAVSTRYVYNDARELALSQAQWRQQLLAKQTANGLAAYYASLLDDLELLKRTEDDGSAGATRPAGAATRPMVLPPRPLESRAPGGPRPGSDQGRSPQRDPRLASPLAMARGPWLPVVLWHQLQRRVSHLMMVERGEGGVQVNRVSFPAGDREQSTRIVAGYADWLATVEEPSVSPFREIADQWMNLVAVPAPGATPRLLVAAVPLSLVQSQFLDIVNSQQQISATLADEDCRIVASSTSPETGLRMSPDNPRLAELLSQSIASHAGIVRRFEESQIVNGQTMAPALMTAEPIQMGDRQWWLVIASTLSDVDTVVSTIFRHAMYWSGFLVLSMTAILISSSVTLIRSRAKLYRLRSEVLQKEISEARKIQLAWLPQAQGSLDGLQIAAVNQPANHISGDFYDWFELPDGRTVVSIGDVSGHGLTAAFLMATTQLLLRTTMLRVKDPGRCLEDVNRQLCHQVFRGQFVTVLVLAIDRERRTVEAAAAGHFPPLAAKDDGKLPTPLGLETELVLGVDPNVHYQTERFDLPGKAALLLYTDGVVDATSPRGQRFSTGRLSETVQGNRGSAREMLDAVVDAVRVFRAEQELVDDLTLVAVTISSNDGSARRNNA